MAYSDILKDAKTTEEMLWKVLLAMQSQAVHIVPVDTGNLRNAITIATQRRAHRQGPVIQSRAQFVGGFVGTNKPNEGAIGVAVEYAHDVEFGIPEKPGYPAQPFLRPTADWMKKKLGLIAAKEYKLKLAEYAIRHPYLLVKVLNGNVSYTEKK